MTIMWYLFLLGYLTIIFDLAHWDYCPMMVTFELLLLFIDTYLYINSTWFYQFMAKLV